MGLKLRSGEEHTVSPKPGMKLVLLNQTHVPVQYTSNDAFGDSDPYLEFQKAKVFPADTVLKVRAPTIAVGDVVSLFVGSG